MESTVSLYHIAPEDVPLSIEVTDAVADVLSTITAFDGLDPDYRRSSRFHKILKMHSRITNFKDGEIIIREGDWGNTASFVISGTAAVELEPPDSDITKEILGRTEIEGRGIWGAISQLWKNSSYAEFRDRKNYRRDATSSIAQRGQGVDTRVYVRDIQGVLDRYKTRLLHAGEMFGEVSALGRGPRSATVFALGDVQLLEMRWQGLRDLRRGDSGFREAVDKRFRETALDAFLLASPIFSHLLDDKEARDEIVRSAELQEFGSFDRVSRFRDLAKESGDNLEQEPIVAEEGHHPNGVYMIRSGVARMSHRHHNGHRTVGYLTNGHAFGLEEITEGFKTGQPTPFQHSLRAIGYMLSILIPTPIIEKHVLKNPNSEVNKAGDQKPSTHRAGKVALEGEQLDEPMLEFLVQERFVNGTATMIIDLDRCTRCDDCVRACASAHDNNPRFLRHGPIHDKYMIANACMHCIDPVCMIECPTGAINRHMNSGEVTINDTTCIGCGTCSRNCPYDAIRMVEVRDADGRFMLDRRTHQPIPKATKCDLCVDQLGGPSCQRACPHDALVRVDLSNLEVAKTWVS